jgi:hypothetical protein
MNATQFAKALADSAPDVQKLIDVGLSEAEAYRFRDAYICNPRITQVLIHDDAVCKLLAAYDVSHVEIGMISFLKDPVQNGDFIQIGKWEADPLKIVLRDQSIIVHELGSKEHILARCASTPHQFLDALAVAAPVLGRCSWDVNLSGNVNRLRVTAKECANAAGGLVYESFFMTLLGAW